jgi:exo-1,4-beta-D-glucosaminidase
MHAGTSTKLFEIPQCEEVSFMFLTLKDSKGNEVATNTYCLSPVDDIHDWDNYNWIRIRLKQHADYKALNDLKSAGVEAHAERDGDTVKVTLTNNSEVVAFFVRMSLKDAAGELVTPAFWSDNFISLRPGETRTYTCKAEGGSNVEISGWNVEKSTLTL